MTDLRTAAQQALEALEKVGLRADARRGCDEAVGILRAALAQQAEPVQEPVAWECKAGGLKPLTQRQYDAQTAATKRHYTRIAPPQRKPLTQEDVDASTAQERDALLDHIYEYGTEAEGVLERIRKLCRAIERAHGIGEQP